MKFCYRGYSRVSYLFLSFNLLLTACIPAVQASFGPTSSPRVTPSPTTTSTATPLPTATTTPSPTSTSTPTAAALVNITLGDEVAVEEGGFSFRPVVGYDLTIRPGTASILRQDGGAVLTMIGTNVSNTGSLDEYLDQLLNNVSKKFQQFSAGETYSIKMGEKKGLGANISGRLGGKHYTGRVLMVAPSDSQIFYAFSFIVDTPGHWEQERAGRQAIKSVLDSVRFFNITIAPTP